MKILVYENWKDYPEGITRPFKTIGSPVKISSNYRKIANWLSTRKQKLLVLVKDLDYENAIVADGQECDKFIKDCLADLGIMFKDRGSEREVK